MNRSIFLVLAGGLAGLLAGCTPAARPPQSAAGQPSPVSESQVQAALHNGGTVLDCGASCADRWGRSQAELTRRYQAGDWVGLATLVLETGYRQDLAYFYLGRAAEGVGADSAALGYYRTAVSLTTGSAADARCAASAAGCGAVSLPNDAVLHIGLAQQAQPRRIVSAPHAAPAQSQPAQPQPANSPPVQIVPPQPQSAEAAPAPSAPASSGDGWIDPPPAGQ